MIIEQLTIELGGVDVAEWLDADAAIWTAFLAQQPGFVSKEVWIEHGTNDVVHLIIRWDSMHEWKSIPEHLLRMVDETMGDFARDPTCRTLTVVRTTRDDQLPDFKP